MTDQPAAAASATPDAPRPINRITGYAWYALFVLVLVYIVNFIDRQILSILAEASSATSPSPTPRSASSTAPPSPSSTLCSASRSGGSPTAGIAAG